jgi:hypothetical protein
VQVVDDASRASSRLDLFPKPLQNVVLDGGASAHGAARHFTTPEDQGDRFPLNQHSPSDSLLRHFTSIALNSSSVGRATSPFTHTVGVPRTPVIRANRMP